LSSSAICNSRIEFQAAADGSLEIMP